MSGTIKATGQVAAVVLLLAMTTAQAKAQFGGGAGGENMMTQFAPMLEMMKAKMGKKRFAMLMQTAGPIMSKMMEGGGGFGGGLGGLGGGPGGGFGDGGFGTDGMGGDIGFTGGGGNIMGMLGGSGMMAMLPQMMSMINTGGGRHGKRRRARHR
ncbi:hypothetical protein X566_20960 [Afipia sp. P52-10]|uniref:hypothetical protein n=1 Tax=Afipia sp. P52-10 TaxID=1429916 RepID=UPI0003DEF597|nr:hypothetical protein [Afipia sp. P52-10]ETR75202.1 hypothetical protein X566_20960 [Afipia sp. P52-10]